VLSVGAPVPDGAGAGALAAGGVWAGRGAACRALGSGFAGCLSRKGEGAPCDDDRAAVAHVLLGPGGHAVAGPETRVEADPVGRPPAAPRVWPLPSRLVTQATPIKAAATARLAASARKSRRLPIGPGALCRGTCITLMTTSRAGGQKPTRIRVPAAIARPGALTSRD